MSRVQSAARDEWRARVQAELGATPFASLVTRTLEGIDVDPLYDSSPCVHLGLGARGPALVGVAYDGPAQSSLAAHLRDDAAAGATCAWIEGPTPPGEVLGLQIFARGADDTPSAKAVIFGSARSPVCRDRDAVHIDGVRWHDAGADAALEVALVCAALLDAMRAGAPQTVVCGTAVDTDFFNEICKLRAMRVLAGRVLATFGVGAEVRVAARTSNRFATGLDDSTSLIRSTIAAAAALIGGADAICVQPHDALGERSERARRIARNVPLVLVLESRLGEVRDAAHGSHFVESRTDALARAAWARVQEIEASGGLARAADLTAPWIDAARAAREAASRTRRSPRVGVSRFAEPSQCAETPSSTAPSESAPGHGYRDAAAFEALRRSAAGVHAELAWVGERRPLEARAAFVRDLVEVAGVEVRAGADELGSGAPIDGYRDAPLVVLIAADAEFGSLPSLARALRERGAKWVAVAGKPGVHEAALRESGVDDFVFVGVDVVTVMTIAIATARSAGER